MKRSFSFSKTWFFSATSMVVTLGFVSLGHNMAWADEFSLIPSGDPIYSQLATLTHTSAKAGGAKSATLTRYEAALQAARAILDAQNRPGPYTSRSDWRAIKMLSVSLKAELRQLGVDPDAAGALADANLKQSVLSSPVPLGGRALSAQSLGNQSVGNQSVGDRTLGGSSLGSPFTNQNSDHGSLLLTSPGLDHNDVKSSAIEMSLFQKLRAGAALQALQRADGDPFNNQEKGMGIEGLANSQNGLATGIASQTSLAYDFNNWLTLRAATSENHLGALANGSPLLEAPFFSGATKTSGAGGGVDVALGSNLKFSTDFESLRTDAGSSASRFGGGASLSAWQNRLSLSAYLSRLLPEDQAILPSTAAELNVGLDVTRRLSLNLLYQGLFAESKNNNSGRVSGGVSLNF